MIIFETHPSSDCKYEYKCSKSECSAIKRHNLQFSLKHKLWEIFLPQGYPNSVSDDYFEYQMWDTIQALASTITTTMANQAVLKGIGVGDETATLLGATLTWITKDGIGLVGRIIFAYSKGTFLDCNCKRWRLFADVLNDLAIFIDIFASYLPRSAFVVMICGSSLCRSIVGVAGGATRAALTMHQAQRNNMADVSAKDGSQESLSNLVGLMINLFVVFLVTGNTFLIMFAVILLTALHLYSNYRAVRSVRMSSFNQSRLHYVVRTWLQSDRIPSVKEGNMAEPVFTGLRRYSMSDIKLGCSIRHLSSTTPMKLLASIDRYCGEGYIIFLEKSFFGGFNVFIVLKKGSGYFEQLKAVFHAELIDYELSLTRPFRKQINYISVIKSFIGGVNYLSDLSDIETKSLEKCNSLIDEFRKTAELGGWVFEPLLLGADEWRLEI